MPIDFNSVRFSGSTNKKDVEEFLEDLADSVENYVTNVSLGEEFDINWSVVDGKPTQFPPEPHVHTVSDVTDLNAAITAISVNLIPDPDNVGLYVIE